MKEQSSILKKIQIRECGKHGHQDILEVETGSEEKYAIPFRPVISTISFISKSGTEIVTSIDLTPAILKT
jgi:hypothetical protein